MSTVSVRTEEVFGDLPTLETDRLLLRKIVMSDAEDLFEYARDREMTRWVMWEAHESVEDSRLFIEWVLDHYRRKQVAPWGIEHKAHGKFIGTIGFHDWNTVHSRAEIGYSIARAYWGQGYTTEATGAVIEFGFRVMDLNRIEARCVPENVASSRVMEKAGMTYEGTLREHEYSKGRFDDLMMYSILRREWTG